MSFAATTVIAAVLAHHFVQVSQDFLLDLRHGLPWLLVAMLLTALLTAELCKLFGARAAVKMTLAPS